MPWYDGQKKDIVAIILAGGKGTRLEEMTTDTAKPAVPFGGKYRIIDFTLSNCRNSQINTVGILTQYKPFELNFHIGEGRNWDLHGSQAGVYLLPPYTEKEGGEWYRGTANAVFQNLDFLYYHNPKYVIILSGDHIYKMDYRKMLHYHIQKQAEVTISVMEVPFEEAHRFGIMNTTTEGEIYEFQEKPEKPKNNLASMGIYIFNFEILQHYLKKDEQNVHSSNDFGKDVIPLLLSDNRKLFAYVYNGYWKDVGTIESYYQANMEILSDNPPLDLYSFKWPIFSDGLSIYPQYISEQAEVQNSIVTAGCHLEGEVTDSILFPKVTIEKGAYIKNSIILENVTIKEGTQIVNSIVCQNCSIAVDGIIGSENENITLIPKNQTLSKTQKFLEKEVLT